MLHLQVYYLTKFSQPYGEGTVILPVLQMRKLRHRGVKAFTQHDTADTWQSWGLNPEVLKESQKGLL